MHWLYHTIRYLLVHWGYWAVVLGLLAENAGMPIPGETTLMLASFLAHKNMRLHLVWIILFGIAGAVAGDNLGFWLGRRLGSKLIRWIQKIFHMNDQDICAAKSLVQRHGRATVFLARFIFGLRTVAGPLAGVLGMDWKKFLLFNFLGAAVWVTVMAVIGYVFAMQFQTLLDYFEKASWAIAGGIFLAGYLFWRHYKANYEQEQRNSTNSD
jgi:membrane protein DedA with SNARE-associated domain